MIARTLPWIASAPTVATIMWLTANCGDPNRQKSCQSSVVFKALFPQVDLFCQPGTVSSKLVRPACATLPAQDAGSRSAISSYRAFRRDSKIRTLMRIIAIGPKRHLFLPMVNDQEW
jgi:hypothetical protein